MRFLFHGLRSVALAAGLGLAACGGGSTSGAGAPGNPVPPPLPQGPTIQSSSTALVMDEGDTGQVQVSLTEAPDSSVTITASIVGGAGTFSIQGVDTIQFDETNWDQPVSISINTATDSDGMNNWGRLQLIMNGGDDVKFIDLTQQDDDGGTVITDGVALQVKEAAGVGATDYPVTAVIPLKYGDHQNTNGFRIVGPSGEAVPAQFEVLNRWWARDNSIRHVAAHFQATTPPSGQNVYVFKDSGGNAAPPKAVTVSTSGNVTTVDTGVLRFTVKKDGFNLFDEVWLDTDGNGSYASSEKIVSSSADNGPVFTGRITGDVQKPADRNDVKLVVEESGPMRVVLRISALTDYQSTTDHTHGFAVRVYAYAGSSSVKVDYQLQNSAKNKKYAWPLYFEDLSLHLKPDLSNPTLRLATGPGNVWSGTPRTGRYLLQESDRSSRVRNTQGDGLQQSGTNVAGRPSYGWADLSDNDRGVFVAIRHMAQMWPSAVEVDGNDDIAVRLWPRHGSQWHEGALSNSGLYWLEDMQHVYREVLFNFHGAGATDAELDDRARTFEAHPIPIVPTSWFHETKVSLDLDGIMPTDQPEPGTDTRQVVWESTSQLDTSHPHYRLGWMNYGGHTQRKVAGQAGGWPRSSSFVMGTERVDAWMTAEISMYDDLNCRPQWMAEYDYDADFDRLRLVYYGSTSWRSNAQSINGYYLDAPYLVGTGFGGWRPRDDHHQWLYRIEEFYYLSGNLWIKDWYDGFKTFAMSEHTVDGGSDILGTTTFAANLRAEAHAWGGLLQSYRMTGDPALLAQIRTRMEKSTLPARKLRYGVFRLDSEACYSAGYMARTMIQLMTETRDGEPKLYANAFNILWGIMDWNKSLSQYAYFINSETAAPGDTASSSVSMIMVDPAAWWFLNTGDTETVTQLRTYITSGLNSGKKPVNEPDDWSADFFRRGGYMGRAGEYIMRYSPTFNAPPAISNVQASMSGSDVRIQWTTPARAKRFHIVWTDKPIASSYDRSDSVRRPWAGTPVSTTLQAQPGDSQSITFSGAPSGETIYVAVFTFGDDNGMSPMSNVATISIP